MALSASVGFFLICKASVNNSGFAPKNMFFSNTFLISPILKSEIYTLFCNKPLPLGGGVWGEAYLDSLAKV
jgi:hypothetical protein